MELASDKTTAPTISSADRAARRSAWIGFLALGGGAIACLLARAAAEASAKMLPTGRYVRKPSEAYLAIVAVMMIATAWGTIDAIRALRQRTTRVGYARIGLILNGGFVVVMLALLAIMIFGALIWSQMGR